MQSAPFDGANVFKDEVSLTIVDVDAHSARREIARTDHHHHKIVGLALQNDALAMERPVAIFFFLQHTAATAGTYAPPRPPNIAFQLSFRTSEKDNRVVWSSGGRGSSGTTSQPSHSRVIETAASLLTTVSPTWRSGSGAVNGVTTVMDVARRVPHNWTSSFSVERAGRPAVRGWGYGQGNARSFTRSKIDRRVVPAAARPSKSIYCFMRSFDRRIRRA